MQQAIVIDPMAVLLHRYFCSRNDGGDVVALGALVLIKGDDEKTVVGLRPVDIGAEMVAKPLVAPRYRAIVHVIQMIGTDEGHSRQFAEIGWKLAEVLAHALRLSKALPWIVLSRRVCFGITNEAVAGTLKLAAQRRRRKQVGTVVDYALG